MQPKNTITKWISERLAEHPSRRSFFSTLGKVVLGAASLISSQSFFAQRAEAQNIRCCDPIGPICPTNACPSGSSLQYTWACHTHDGGHYLCNDCNDNNSGAYICTYMTSSK